MKYLIILLLTILSNTRIWGMSVPNISLSPTFKTALSTSEQWESAKEYGVSCFIEPNDSKASVRASIRSLSVIHKKEALTRLYTPLITQLDLCYPVYEKPAFFILGVTGYLVDLQEGKWNGFYVGLHTRIKSKSDFSCFIEPGIHQQQLTLTLGFHQPITIFSKNDKHHPLIQEKTDKLKPIEAPVEEKIALNHPPAEEKLNITKETTVPNLLSDDVVEVVTQNRNEEKKQLEDFSPDMTPHGKKEDLSLILDDEKEYQVKKSRLFEMVYLQNKIKSDFLDTHHLNWASYAIALCTQLNLIGAFNEENAHFFRPYEELSQLDADKLLKGIAYLANQNKKNLMIFSTDEVSSRLSFMRNAGILLQSLGVKKSFQNLSYVHYQDWIELSVFDAYDLSPYIKILGYGGDKQYNLNPKKPILRSEAAVIGQKLMLWTR